MRYIEENVPSIQAAASLGGPVADRLHRIALAVLDVALSADCVAVRRLIVAEAGRFPEFGRLLHDFGIARIEPLIERCLDEGNASGEIAVADTRHAGDLFVSIAIRGFIEKTELGLERPGLSHVKRETLRRNVDFFVAAVRKRE